jgi:D-3-phosphoglycerate dehydrogenase
MIGAKELGLMKISAFLVNVARAQIVDKETLFRALFNNKISGAAFDAFWEEPADPNDKLLKICNFVLAYSAYYRMDCSISRYNSKDNSNQY